MPTATRDLYHASVTLPKIHTSYPTPSPTLSMKQPAMLQGTSRELPMPTVNRITNLNQAQATLLHCSTKLSKSWQNNPGRSSPPSSPLDSESRRHFQRWLEQWEQAFTSYLSLAMAGMKSEDITRCRILKANHLSCTILAAGSSTDPRSFNGFESDFQAIVELASAVMQSRSATNSPSGRGASPGDGNQSAGSLNVRGPLYVVAARCDRVNIRAHAVELLGRIDSPH